MYFFRGHQQRRSHLKPWKMPLVWQCDASFFVPPFVKNLRSHCAVCVSPSSGQCRYGRAGTRAEETSGGKISKGSFWGDSCPLWGQGTTLSFFSTRMKLLLFQFHVLNYIFGFVLSLPGHTTAEQTQSNLWDYNQVRTSALGFGQLRNIW